jgi:PAS domain S-box-containing protein
MKDKSVILVVDDQPQKIELLEAYLVPQGYEIVKAANGEEALGKLSDNQIDLILLDVMMPGSMDGFEVIRRVRKDNTHRLLPIILVTALRETEDRIKGLEAGCDDFISYPVDKMELLARVRSLLKVKAYNDLMSNYRKELESEASRRTEELKHALEDLQQDIAERKQAEEALRETKETLHALFQASPFAIIALDPVGNVTRWNKAAEKMFGWQESEALGQFLPFVPDDSRDEHRLLRERVLRGEAFTNIEVRRRKKDGSPIDISISTAPLRDVQGQVTGIMSVNTDITERKRAEKQLQDTLESLRKASSTIIQVMVSAVETRDPYTAGHQTRSADLSRAIATEMGLSKEKIDGIRMAGSIHDIGKLSIPAEILSRPSKLSELEFSLVKEHAQRGYEILKKVESPWPLAEMVYQHHERVDGSGYPRNLKGEEILLEARILAVADVVEAMASHRPYRPALGMQAALDEIARNRDTLYDPEVVAACLRLINVKGFKLK